MINTSNPDKDLTRLLKSLKKRDEILKGIWIARIYNYHFDVIRRITRKFIDQNRQDELFYLLESENISYRRDMAGMLYHAYPEKCKEVLQEISEMTVPNGLPKYYVNLSVSAYTSLKIGIPKDFP